MYQLGRTSKARVLTTHEIIQHIVFEAIPDSPVDFGIPRLGGFRTAEEQHEQFLDGASQLDGYTKKSYHQTGCAIDIFPYVNGKADYDMRYVLLIAGHILGTANRLGYELRWGGDWDGDLDLDDQRLNDLVHFEIHVE